MRRFDDLKPARVAEAADHRRIGLEQRTHSGLARDIQRRIAGSRGDRRGFVNAVGPSWSINAHELRV
jgi:hypothetical protein